MAEEENKQKSYAGQLLTPAQVGTILNVDPATVRGWANDGTIPSIELPSRSGAKRKRRRIRGETVDKLLGNA